MAQLPLARLRRVPSSTIDVLAPDCCAGRAPHARVMT
jgi:hypothetical protein